MVCDLSRYLEARPNTFRAVSHFHSRARAWIEDLKTVAISRLTRNSPGTSQLTTTSKPATSQAGPPLARRLSDPTTPTTGKREPGACLHLAIRRGRRRSIAGVRHRIHVQQLNRGQGLCCVMVRGTVHRRRLATAPAQARRASGSGTGSSSSERVAAGAPPVRLSGADFDSKTDSKTGG